MAKLFFAIALALLSVSSAVAEPKKTAGQVVLDRAFDPALNFRGDPDSGGDELVLTVWASARDDYAPAYSLSIAYRCRMETGEYQCAYTARMLRTGGRDKEFKRSLELVALAKATTDATEMRRSLEEARLEWLEADVAACPNGIFAMDSVRVADWNPDIHPGLQSREDRDLIMHPAAIRVTMFGSYTRSAYEGWRLAAGVPSGIQKLLETLEPCWKPGTSRRPWNRR